MNYKSYGDLGFDISCNISKVQGDEYDLVVGIPRSGMIPAYMIALLLNIDCTSLDAFIRNSKLQRGTTRNNRSGLSYAWDAKKVLLVDDSVLSGNSMEASYKSIPSECPCEVKKLAIYAEKQSTKFVDIYFSIVKRPRVFQWNIFHHSVLYNSCVDIDGVLCVDPTGEQNDDGCFYEEFLVNATPLYLPTCKVDSIVTNRLEKYRPQTEMWLKRHGVIYDNLVMLDLPSKEARKRLGIHAKNKAEYYKSSGTNLFIESEENQAKKIAEISGKPVYCVEANCMFYPNFLSLIKSGKKSFIKTKVSLLIKYVASQAPKPLKEMIKSFSRVIYGKWFDAT